MYITIKKHINLIISITCMVLLCCISVCFSMLNAGLTLTAASNTGSVTTPMQGTDVKITNLYTRCTNISFSFYFYGFKNTYENLFQTSEGNAGIRLEFANVGADGLWGVVVPGKKKEQVLSFQNIPSQHTWHDIDIAVRGDKLTVFLDGSMQGVMVLENPNYRIDDIAIGTGVSKSRSFNGIIKNFDLKVYKAQPIINVLFFVIMQMIVLLLLLFFAKYREKELCNFLYSTNICIHKSILRIIPLLLITVVVIRSIRDNILEGQYIYYELFVLILVILLYLWNVFKLEHFSVVILLIAIFMFLKSFFIHFSFWGIISDLFLGLLIVGFIQNLLSTVPHNFTRIIRLLFCFITSLAIGFLTVGVLYIRYIQKISGPTTLFGEEFQAILQTNVHEAFEFMQAVFSISQLLCIVAAICITAVICYYALNSSMVSKRAVYKFFIGMFVLTGLTAYNVGLSQSICSPILVLADGYRHSVKQIQHLQKLREKNSDISANKLGKGETYVLVIGEAGNKRHTSAYGYFRDTTPWMKSLRNKKNTVFLENAYSSFVHTIPSLLNVLTSANQYNQKINFESPSIIEVAKKAGFKTYWFSNQERYSLIDNPLTVIAKEADFVYFTPKANLGPDGE